MNQITSTAHQSEHGYWEAVMYLNGERTETTCLHCHHTSTTATKCANKKVSDWQQRFDTAFDAAPVDGFTEVKFINKQGRTCTFRYRIIAVSQ
jgi:hypothetical protein